MDTPPTRPAPASSRFTFATVWQGMLLGMAVIAAGLLAYDWAGVRGDHTSSEQPTAPRAVGGFGR